MKVTKCKRLCDGRIIDGRAWSMVHVRSVSYHGTRRSGIPYAEKSEFVTYIVFQARGFGAGAWVLFGFVGFFRDYYLFRERLC